MCKYFCTLFFALFACCLSAQIPLRHPTPKFKGPVIKAETKTFSKVELDENGKPDLDKTPDDKIVLIVENGLTKQMVLYNKYLSGMHEMMMKFDYEYDVEGNLVQVKKYDVDNFSKNKNPKLDRTSTARYRNGKLVSENMVEKNGKLLASFEYWEENDAVGQPILMIQHLDFENGEMKKRQRYGVQYVDGLKTLHFSINGTDTTFFAASKRLTENKIMAWGFTTRRDERKNYTAFNETLERDQYGNTTLEIAWGEDENSEKSLPEYQVTRYLYEGETDWAPDVVPPFLQNVQGNWTSRTQNLNLRIGTALGDAKGGIYGVEKIQESDGPEIMDEGDAWIYALLESQIGEWTWDETANTLTFAQNKHLIVQVNAEILHEMLILKPEEKRGNTLRLVRE